MLLAGRNPSPLSPFPFSFPIIAPTSMCECRIHFQFHRLAISTQQTNTFVQQHFMGKNSCMNMRLDFNCNFTNWNTELVLYVLRWYWGEIHFWKNFENSMWASIWWIHLNKMFAWKISSFALWHFFSTRSSFFRLAGCLACAIWAHSLLYPCATDHFKFIYSNPHHSFI